jgi:hypothetical protein
MCVWGVFDGTGLSDAAKAIDPFQGHLSTVSREAIWRPWALLAAASVPASRRSVLLVGLGGEVNSAQGYRRPYGHRYAIVRRGNERPRLIYAASREGSIVARSCSRLLHASYARPKSKKERHAAKPTIARR